MQDAELIHGDCLNVLPSLSGIDCIVTDPVWPNAIARLHGSDDPYSLFAKAAAFFPKIAKTVVIHLGCTSDPRFLNGMPKEMPFFRTVWLRYNFPAYRGRVLIGSDVAYVFGVPPKARKGNRVIKGEVNGGDGSMNVAQKQRGKHPTPRKIEHVSELVSMFSNEGDTVLDPFMGSGTTGIACLRMRRKFVGIEIDTEFFQAAKDRIYSCQRPMDL